VGNFAQIALEPAEYGRTIKGTVRTVPGSGNNISVHIPAGTGIVRIDGAIGINAQCRTIYRSVPQPEEYFAQTLVGFLHGLVRPFGELNRSAIRISTSPVDTAKMKFFQEYRSKPLVAFVADMNTFSNNVIAEQLVHLLGKEKEAEMFDYELGRDRIYEAIKSTFKAEVVIRDGSGLSRENRLSASLLAHLIRAAVLSPEFGVEFERSFAVTGRTGTLFSRKFSIPPYHLRAKTGSLTGVNGLAGTLVPHSGEKIVFAVIQNSTKSRSRALEEERRFIESLYKNY
jgi:D-alanyl-D-alanine carboxypeptidase/D-alanyl-D-alanine-endopeptidase (penicillin-binding protein 4)